MYILTFVRKISYEGLSINKLQNSVILLIFQI